MGENVGREVELEPQRIAHGGIAVARLDGRVVFVSDAIPGERVVARVTDDRKKAFWRADTVSVLEPSPHRRPHVWAEAALERDPDERAGGAEFGHIAVPHQRELKAQVLADALQRFGGIERAVEVEGLPGAEDGTRWRTRVRLHVDDDGVVGPYAARSHRVIPVASLPLAVEEVEALAPRDGMTGVETVDVLAPTDGEARLIANDGATEWPDGKVVEHFNPYRLMFGWVWNGRRHVIMGGSQIDRFGNQNFAAIGTYRQPKVQLLGYRGAPGNTINDTTSYWVPKHSPQVIVREVDTVCGIGYDRARELGPTAARFHEIRRVVTNLAVLDFATADHAMRIASVHPGVTVDEVQAATGFTLAVPDDVPATRQPTDEELKLLREVLDPKGFREKEVPNA